MYNNGSELQSAIMILQLVIQGTTFLFKVPAGISVKVFKTLGAAIYHAYTKDNKEVGRTNMKQMVARGGDIQIFQFNKKDKKLVTKLLKSYGILYSRLPDINLEDGKMEIMFHSEAIPRIAALMKRVSGTIIDCNEYIENSAPEDVKEMMEEVKEEFEQENIKKNDISEKDLSKATKKDTKQSRENIEMYFNISIDESLIIKENSESYFLRVPNSESKKYIWVDKDKLKIKRNPNGKITLYSKLKKDEEIPIFNFQGKFLHNEKGGILAKHYDIRKVERGMKPSKRNEKKYNR